MLRRASAIGIALLPLLALAESARGDNTTDAIAGGVASWAVLTVVCATTALTQAGEGGYAREGFLVGLAGSYAIETFADDAEEDLESALEEPVGLSVDDSIGINGRIGYRCHSRFSAAVEVEWLDKFEVDASLVSDPDTRFTVDLEPLVITTNLKGYLLTGRFQPFLLVGPGVMTAKVKERAPALDFSSSERETEFAVRFGGGLDLYATENIVLSVGADYVLPFGVLDDLDYISIGWGFQYRF